MASNWYDKQADQELGPYTFRDLFEMVREEKLTAEVLVPPHYLNEWQRADSVIGLFHIGCLNNGQYRRFFFGKLVRATEHDFSFAETDRGKVPLSPDERMFCICLLDIFCGSRDFCRCSDLFFRLVAGGAR